MKSGLIEIIPEAIPQDHCDQATALSLLREVTEEQGLNDLDQVKVLDLGCGDGRSFEALKKVLTKMSYCGVDIEASPEVSIRTRDDLRFDTYDGVNLPYEPDSMDVIFSSQVLEHVRHPDQLIKSANRVLRKGGVFVGSVSFLEPYHSFSIFNWSPYGIVTVFRDSGFDKIVLRPGIDGIALTLRRIFGREHFGASFAKNSLFNYFIGENQIQKKRSPQQINAHKLAIAGHICFYALK